MESILSNDFIVCFMSEIFGILKEEMPRERLIEFGPSALSEVELLAIILRVGTREKNVIELSREIISEFTSNVVSRKTYDELIKISGVKKAKACSIVAVFELSRRLYSKGLNVDKICVKNSLDIYELVCGDFSGLLNERVMCVFVDVKNRVIKKEFVFEGGLNYSIIEPREIIKRVLALDASGFFLVHNHPSGDLSPSGDDISITIKIKGICDELNIRFLDHVIVGDGFYSLFDNDML